MNKPTKIIFLDIDGVMNTVSSSSNRWSEQACHALTDLIQRTNAHVVFLLRGVFREWKPCNRFGKNTTYRLFFTTSPHCTLLTKP